MKRLPVLLLSLFAVLTMTTAQTMNVKIGEVTYAYPTTETGDMEFHEGTSLTILGKTYTLDEVESIEVTDDAVEDNTVSVVYSGRSAQVTVAGNIADYITVATNGAHVSITQSDDVAEEITYSLSGSTDDGEFYMTGSYKATVELLGLTLTNSTPVYSGAALCIMDGKRVSLSVKKETENTLTDAASGSQKAALYCKGHLEMKGQGTLNVNGKLAHAIKSAEYMQMKNCTVNILSAMKDGISCDEYFLMESGALTIKGTGDDAIQCDIDGTASTGVTTDHEGEDSGNIYIIGGTVGINTTNDAAKGIKAGGDVRIADGTVIISQTGGILVEDDDISYPTAVKSTGDIVITGGTVTVTNTADGGKGFSADGNISIDESNATTIINIVANGIGGTAETTGSGTDEPAASYKVYVSLPTSGGGGPGGGPGGGSAWSKVYLYKSDGTLVQQLTSSVTKSSGYSSLTFYYYDFGEAVSGTYYFKSDNYTSQSWGGSTTYTIKSATFSAPTTGTDVYYSITNSYSTSGTTRTYSLTNVTSTYGGSSDVSEDTGTSYNAAGIKADGNVTIGGGTISVKNSGSMSKSIKSKAVVTINGGTITLTPSGEMKVINNDASYSSAIKTVDFIQNDGTLTIIASGQASRGITATNITTNGGTLKITNSGAGVQGSSDNYTAKGLKADSSIKLNGGTITISMSGTGGKGIKSAGTYTQGTTDGNGPTLTVTTTGSSLGGSTGGGGWWSREAPADYDEMPDFDDMPPPPPSEEAADTTVAIRFRGPGGGPGQESSGGSSAKGIKVQGTIYLYGGTTEVYTSTDGAEGLESKTAIYIEGGQHYFKCYDDCINSSGKIFFNGGVTVCYGYGNDAVDSNANTTGAITIGNGAVFAYTTKGSPEEGLDCDNNSYIQITGTGIAISAGGAQGGGSSSSTISNAKQGYSFVTSPTISYTTGRYYTLSNASGTNLVTYSFEASCSSSLALFTATGMVKGSTYYVKYSTTAPTDATTAWHGLYLGSTATATNSVTSFTAK